MQMQKQPGHYPQQPMCRLLRSRQPQKCESNFGGSNKEQTTADNQLNCEWLPQNHTRNKLTAAHRKGHGSGLVLPSWAKQVSGNTDDDEEEEEDKDII